MVKLRRRMAFLVVFAMLFGMLFQTAFASSGAGFSDVKGHWAEAQILKWADSGVISGDKGRFRPDSEITRAEFCTIVNNLFGFSEKSPTNFSDVKPGTWYADQTAIAKEAGYISGYGNNRLGPDDKITRQDAAVIFKAVLRPDSADQSAVSFADKADIASYARDAVSFLTAKGYITGYDNHFYPKKGITRAEVITILDKAVEGFYAAAGTYADKNVEGNVIVKTGGVVLKDMVIGGNLYLSEGIGQGTVTLDNVTVKGKTFASGGGENSIVLENTTLGVLVIEKRDGKIRILAKGSTAVSGIQLNSGAKLEEEGVSGSGFGNVEVIYVGAGQQIVLDGDFEEINVEAPGASVQVTGGTVGSLNIAAGASDSKVQVAQGAVIDTFKADAPVTVNGQGKITTANVNANNVSIETRPTNVNVAPGITASIGGVTQTGNNSAGGGNGGGGNNGQSAWTLVWSDEFNGTSLDASKWRLEDKGDGFGNNEEQYYRPGNAVVEDGRLVIKAKKETYGGRDYTSAKLFSKADWKYGKFEARVKLPLGQGFWPAFWMMPTDGVYGGWAASGEIDIMEAKGRLPGNASGTLHYGGAWPNNKYTGKDYNFPDGQTIDQFHTYSIEWEPGEFRWYIDGNLYQTQNNWNTNGADGEEKYAFPAPFDQKFYLMLNLAIGGNFDGGLVPPGGLFPAQMEVDYVRVYELTGRPYKTPVEPATSAEPLPAGARQPDGTGNLVKDINFEQGIKENQEGVDADFGEGWNYIHNAQFGGAATVTVDGISGKNYAKVNVTDTGSQTYSIQLEQLTTLGKGRWYRYSFDAKGDGSRTLNTKLGGGSTAGWAAYSDSYTVNLTTEFQHFERVFQMTPNSDILTRIEFNCATGTGTAWIGNVRVEEVGPPAVDYNASKDPLPVSGNHIYNGDFDKYTIDRMAYWNVTKTGSTAAVSVPENTRELTVDVADGGTSPGAITVGQKGIKLANGNGYKLAFSARAAAGRTIKVRVASADGSVDYLPLTAQNITLSTAMQRFEAAFTMDSASDPGAQLLFLLGGSNTDVYIDDVSLLKTSVDYSQIDMYPLKNGDFSTGTDSWENWIGEEGSGDISLEGGQAKVAVSGAGKESWSIQFYQGGLNLTKDMKYVVAFDVRSTKARKIELSLENSAYHRYFEKIIDVGTETTHFEETFTMPQDDLIAFKLLLGKTNADVSGLGAHDIFIDNVVCEVKDAKFLTSVARNGQFSSGLEPWQEWTGDGGAADVSVEDGEMKIAVSNVGPNSWSVQALQEGLRFENGQTYRLSFKARADAARKMNINIGKALAADPWFTAYMTMKTADLTTDMQEYVYDFTMSEPTYDNAKIVFEAGNVSDGNALTNIYIDDVAINKVVKVVERVAKPTFSPADGAFIDEQTVIITSATSGAAIRYTTDGSVPDESSPLYEEPIVVSATTTIKAYAVKEGLTDSDVVTAKYGKSHEFLNGGFDTNTDYWEFYTGDDSNAAFSIDDGRLKVNFPDYDGWEVWSTQVYQRYLLLGANKTYRLSFNIKCTIGKPVQVAIENATFSDVKYLDNRTISLTANNTTGAAFEFSTGQATEPNAKLVFLFGSQHVPGENFQSHSIYLDDVILEEVVLPE